jgi:hypothetical protein
VAVQADQWPASKQWSREYLAQALGGRKIVAGGYHFSFQDYLAYIDNSRCGLTGALSRVMPAPHKPLALAPAPKMYTAAKTHLDPKP